HGQGGVLVALALPLVAQGRGIRPCPAGPRDPARLRCRRDPARGRAGRRHRLPHRSSFLLLPPARRRSLGSGRPGAARSRRDLSQVGVRPMAALSPSPGSAELLERLGALIASRRGADPEASYVATLFAKGTDAILKKIGEEATETVMAAKDGGGGRTAPSPAPRGPPPRAVRRRSDPA